jgi:hypothetical protein
MGKIYNISFNAVCSNLGKTLPNGNITDIIDNALGSVLPFCYLVNPLSSGYNKTAISTPIPGGEEIVIIDELNPSNSAVFSPAFYNNVKPEFIINLKVVFFPEITTLSAFASSINEQFTVIYTKKNQLPVTYNQNTNLDVVYISNPSTSEVNRTFAKGIVFEINLSGADFLNMDALTIQAPDFITSDQKKKIEVQTTILDFTN